MTMTTKTMKMMLMMMKMKTMMMMMMMMMVDEKRSQTYAGFLSVEPVPLTHNECVCPCPLHVSEVPSFQAHREKSGY